MFYPKHILTLSKRNSLNFDMILLKFVINGMILQFFKPGSFNDPLAPTPVPTRDINVNVVELVSQSL